MLKRGLNILTTQDITIKDIGKFQIKNVYDAQISQMLKKQRLNTGFREFTEM